MIASAADIDLHDATAFRASVDLISPLTKSGLADSLRS
jgi:hypothetical protein